MNRAVATIARRLLVGNMNFQNKKKREKKFANRKIT
jgi:hypothetical protein